MAYTSNRRDNRRGTYWKRGDAERYGADGEAFPGRDPNALGNAHPSRYGLSSPANFPPARSPRSPDGIYGNDTPELYEEDRSEGPKQSVSRKNSKTSKTNRKPPQFDPPRRDGEGKNRHTDAPHGKDTQGDRELDQSELDRLYRIATGQREPKFQDAFREGPWEKRVLRRRAFFLCLAEYAVYALCFYYLLTPLTVLTARLGGFSAPVTAALISLAGTLVCGVFWLFFKERRMLYTAWGWLAGTTGVLALAPQVLLWGEAQAQWAALRFCGFFLLGPVTANGILALGLLYLHWRGEHPRPKPVRETEEEEDNEEEAEDRVPPRRSYPIETRADERSGRSPSTLDRNGWNRNLDSRSGWEWNEKEHLTANQRQRWRQTEAERDGRRQAASYRNNWK